jgi:hypothetical protein
LEKITNYEAPHYVVFFNLLSFQLSLVQIKVSPPEGRMQIEVIWEQYAEENIWTQERQRNKEEE